MRDDDPVARNLAVKQGIFFAACERRGLTLAALAAATEIPASTLGSYKPVHSRATALMGLCVFNKLARVVPAELMSMLIEDSGFQLAPVDPVAADWLGLGGRTAAFAAKVCQFQQTGNHIDHREAAELRDEMLIIIAEGHGAIAVPGGGAK